jgi:integrase/recombinase XerC
VTISELATQWLTERVRQHKLNPMTARNYRSTFAGLVAAVGDIPPDQLTTDTLEHWLEARAHLSAATRRGDLSAVRGFCAWLVRHGTLDSNPAVDVEPIRQTHPVPRAFDTGQTAALFAVLPDLRAEAIVWLQLGLGLRCAEVAALRIEHWSRRADVVLVNGKGSRQRELPVIPEVRAALVAYLAEYPAADGPLIRSYRRPAHGLAADTISGMVAEWMRAAGVKLRARDGNSAHALRHTAASDVLEASKDLRAVQAMLGHAQLQTTSVYLRRAELGRLREAMSGRDYRPAA